MKVGQKVWIQCTNYGNKDKVQESEIRKIGRKYIYTYNMRFYIDTLQEDRGDYSSDHRLWLSKQDYEDNQELEKNFSELRSKFGSHTPNITLDQSRAILAILEPEEECDKYYTPPEYIVADNDGENDYALDFEKANEMATEWFAEQSDPTGYKVGIYKKIKNLTKKELKSNG